MELKKAAEIAALKLRLIVLYSKYSLLRGKYDCGAELAEYLNPDITKTKDEINQILDRLAVIDHSAPKTRVE